MRRRYKTLLFFLIFVLAFLVRFLYFPDNVNFGFDQARDSFAALDILKGDLKIVGPPTTVSDQIFHGVLFYYILAPIYFFSGGSIEVAALILRVLNAAGVVIVFYIASILFNKKVGLISAFLFALSFEQSQYSLFFGHPSPGAISVLIYYLGLALLFLKEKPWGFLVALVGLGLTIQFEDVNGLLLISLLSFLIVFHQKLKLLNLKIIFLSFAGFALTVSSFLLVELKFNFRTTQAILSAIINFNTISSANFSHLLVVLKRFIHDNFISFAGVESLAVILIFAVFVFFYKNYRPQILFLIIWFLAGIIPHIISGSFSYYYSPGASVSLIILISFFLFKLSLKIKPLAILILSLIVFSNINLVLTQNSKGPNPDIVIQPGMILYNQKKVLDYIYNQAGGQEFAVNGLTVPLNVKTTWDYLFNWYGQKKYGYIPVWADAADGFPGSLKVVSSRSELPQKRFTIIEPTVGIGSNHAEDFFKTENYFTKVIEERNFGTITVQMRESF